VNWRGSDAISCVRRHRTESVVRDGLPGPESSLLSGFETFPFVFFSAQIRSTCSAMPSSHSLLRAVPASTARNMKSPSANGKDPSNESIKQQETIKGSQFSRALEFFQSLDSHFVYSFRHHEHSITGFFASTSRLESMYSCPRRREKTRRRFGLYQA
jgi:hypothetical protein